MGATLGLVGDVHVIDLGDGENRLARDTLRALHARLDEGADLGLERADARRPGPRDHRAPRLQQDLDAGAELPVCRGDQPPDEVVNLWRLIARLIPHAEPAAEVIDAEPLQAGQRRDGRFELLHRGPLRQPVAAPHVLELEAPIVACASLHALARRFQSGFDTSRAATPLRRATNVR